MLYRRCTSLGVVLQLSACSDCSVRVAGTSAAPRSVQGSFPVSHRTKTTNAEHRSATLCIAFSRSSTLLLRSVCRSEERRVGKSADLGGRLIIKKKQAT